MPRPPDPANPTVRVRLVYNEGAAGESGNRIFLQYGGTTPTGSVLTTLAGDIASAWSSHIAPLVNEDITLNEVDCLDITTDTGASGYWTGADAGTRSGTAVPVQVCLGVEFDIATRYRGGKPRIYLPGPTTGDYSTINEWSSAFVSAAETDVAAFFAAVVALTPGAMAPLSHVALSYYQGVNTATPPWRGPGYKYPPKYRSSAIAYPVTGYAIKQLMASQRRRRSSTTP